MPPKTLGLVLATLASATLATAQLSPQFKEWPNGPVSLLFTKGERKAYDKLATDLEAQKFIDLFWARRDPDLSTAVNELKIDFESRAAAAERQFAYRDTPGYLTDRGRTLILLGPPREAGDLPVNPGQGAVENRSSMDKGTPQIWVYTRDQLPGKIRGEEVIFYFLESRRGAGDFQLPPGDQRNAEALRLLKAAPERLLVHPDLQEVPKAGVLAGARDATPAELATLAIEPRPWPEGAAAFVASGWLSEALHPLWVSVQLPESAPVATQVVGRVSRADTGAEVGTFARSVAPLPCGGGRSYELAFALEPGEWKIELALLGEGNPLAVTSVQAWAETSPGAGTYLSQLYWGVEIRKDESYRPGDPFTIGGWHATPRASNRYAKDESLSYFCFVLRPALDAQQQPQAEVSLGLYRGKQKLSEGSPAPTRLSRVAGDLWMVGAAMPLAAFNKPGDLRLEITVRDPRADVSRTTRIPLVMTTAPAPAAP
ncbi:MAG: GWxTD domain-containing protein [Acidobacteriota bacterium]